MEPQYAERSNGLTPEEFAVELLSNLVYDHQAAFLSDWSSTSIPSRN